MAGGLYSTKPLPLLMLIDCQLKFYVKFEQKQPQISAKMHLMINSEKCAPFWSRNNMLRALFSFEGS